MSTQSQASVQWEEKLFSESTNTLLRSIDAHPDGANLLRLMEILHELHDEYGTFGPPGETPFADLITLLRPRQASVVLMEYSGIEWVNKALSITTGPGTPPDINGRMFLIAVLLFEFPEVSRLLGEDPHWKEMARRLVVQLEAELLTRKKIDFHNLLTEQGLRLREMLDVPAPVEEWDDEDSLTNTPNLTDTPTDIDALSRKTLAIYLAKRLRFVFNRDISHGNAFFVHIDGAWGSGKSTLLGFLQKALEAKAPANPRIKPEQKSEGEWIVVNFNAWENQRLDPPWWFLLKALHRQASKALWDRGDFRRWLGVWLTGRLWRLNRGGRNLQIALVALCIFLYASYSGVKTGKSLQELPSVELISFLVFIWSTAKTLGSVMSSGSAKAAQAFVEENSSDPMNKLTEHFNRLIMEIDYPVAIFIDDLDRCNKEYGVKLLEGLQTIYKNAPVVYVIAADRRWLSTMYENQYSLFAPAITKPAKPFGFVFLDKIFQWTVELPEISASQKRMYWNSLLNISEPGQKIDEKDIGERINAEPTLNGKRKIVDGEADPRMQQVARELGVDSLSIQEEEKLLEHKLQDFLSLIEPNPRGMKRLLNDISTAKTMAFLYNQRISEEQLILWTILKQQYPDLARIIWETPETVSTVFSNNASFKTFTELLNREEVKQLFEYKIRGRTIRLDLDFLNRMKFQAPH